MPDTKAGRIRGRTMLRENEACELDYIKYLSYTPPLPTNSFV